MRRLFLPTIVLGLLVVPASASAVTVARAQLSGGELRVEGSNAAPGIFITAQSSTSAAGSRADTNGNFKIQATGFRAPDCTITVDDSGRTPTATAKLSGCTPDPAAVNPPPPAPAPTGTCVIDPGAPATFTAGTSAVYNFTTTGCVGGPLQWTVIAGVIPTGMSGPNFQGQTAGNIIGTPTTPGTYTFTAQATDGTGATDAETFTITVVAPQQPAPGALAISNASMPGGQRGKAYSVTLTATGGSPGYTWSLLSGTLPNGLRLSGNTITGTPTTRATNRFTLRVTDAAGASADRAFSIAIN
jgi:hypothetical protein